MYSKPGKSVPSLDPHLFSQGIQVVFEMKLYITSAVLLRGMNLGFFLVISLKTAKKMKAFCTWWRKKKQQHAGHLRGLFPLRPYHHQDIEKTKARKYFLWGHNFNCISGSREASFKQYASSIVLHVWSFYLETHTPTLSEFREAFIVHPLLWKSKQRKGKIVNAKGIQIRNRFGRKSIHKKGISQMSIICPKYISFDGKSNLFFLSSPVLKFVYSILYLCYFFRANRVFVNSRKIKHGKAW